MKHIVLGLGLIIGVALSDKIQANIFNPTIITTPQYGTIPTNTISLEVKGRKIILSDKDGEFEAQLIIEHKYYTEGYSLVYQCFDAKTGYTVMVETYFQHPSKKIRKVVINNLKSGILILEKDILI